MTADEHSGDTGPRFRLPPRIEGERVVIRPLEGGDRQAFVAMMTDRASTRFVFADEQKTEAGFAGVAASPGFRAKGCSSVSSASHRNTAATGTRQRRFAR